MISVCVFARARLILFRLDFFFFNLSLGSGQRDFMFLGCRLPERERQVPDVCRLD